jgi:hypothetical protein
VQSLSPSLTVVAFIYAHFGVAILLSRRRLAERLCTAASDKPRVIRKKGFIFGNILHFTTQKRANPLGKVRCRLFPSKKPKFVLQNTLASGIFAGMGICLSDRIGAPLKMQYPDIETKYFEKRRGVMITNKLRAQKASRSQATRGLRGKSPYRLFITECRLRQQHDKLGFLSESFQRPFNIGSRISLCAISPLSRVIAVGKKSPELGSGPCFS